MGDLHSFDSNREREQDEVRCLKRTITSLRNQLELAHNAFRSATARAGLAEREATERERQVIERCAQVAEGKAERWNESYADCGKIIARAIRALAPDRDEER